MLVELGSMSLEGNKTFIYDPSFVFNWENNEVTSNVEVTWWASEKILSIKILKATLFLKNGFLGYGFRFLLKLNRIYLQKFFQ